MELADKEEQEFAKTRGDIDAGGTPYITDEELRKQKLYHKLKAAKKLKFNDSENGIESKKDLDYGLDIAEVAVNEENIEQEVHELIERLKKD
ncbi:hypothetical protein ILUMI_15762 [Ignelater luminosus]|uniref:Uncharacterized protein n=1 Tax=Ignelater luminosus TaxID=2038154 RepID=A0A8K0CSF5_IGNLU|nr:hypothetical protein ILUMI_15762 [Ignelater luminosus]